MRTQIWIIGAAFAIFGIIAIITNQFSLSYIGLVMFGIFAIVIGAFSPK